MPIPVFRLWPVLKILVTIKPIRHVKTEDHRE